MTTATKSRKRVKPERRVQISPFFAGGYAMLLTIGTGEKAKRFGYYIDPIPADFGLAFHLEKFAIDKAEGEPSEYDVNLDLQRGSHSCTCKGNTYCGHCKHVESVLALIKSGKIDVPMPQPQTEPEPIEFDDP
jgi:hypothetical protein